MVKLFEFMFYTLPLILAWIYLLIAVLALVMCAKNRKNKEKTTFGRRIFLFLNCIYVLFFIIARIFFFELWEMVFAVLGVMAMIVSMCWSRYDDMVHGRRWWNWKW